MSDFHKNFIVGITMLLGLVLLASLIIMFGKAPAQLFAADKMKVIFEASRADGLSDGSGVFYLGKDVGSVESVELDQNDRRRLIIHALVNITPALPQNIMGKIRSQLIGGGSKLDLQLIDRDQNGELLPNPVPQGQLDPSKRIEAEFVGVDVLPPEIGELAAELRLTVEELRKSNLVDNTNQLVKDIQKDAQGVGKLVDLLNQNLGDPKVQEDFKASLANIRGATDHAVKVGENLEKFSAGLDPLPGKFANVADDAATTLGKVQKDMDQITGKINDRLVQAANLEKSVQSILDKIDNGQGTAGKLVNDPKLYQEMAGTAQELKQTIADLKLLIDQWTDEGVSMKLSSKK